MGGVSKRPVSAEIRYYHGRRRHPSRSFDATPWHQLGRPAWDASPPVHPRAPYHPPSSPRRKPTDIAIAPHLNEQVPPSPAPSTISTSSSAALTHPHLHLNPTAISITTPTPNPNPLPCPSTPPPHLCIPPPPPPLPEQLSKTQHALTGAHMALVDERRKTLSARLDNTRFRVELEATKHARTASTEVATMARPCLMEGQGLSPQIREAARLGMCVR